VNKGHTWECNQLHLSFNLSLSQRLFPTKMTHRCATLSVLLCVYYENVVQGLTTLPRLVIEMHLTVTG